jgi:putative membrane protein
VAWLLVQAGSLIYELFEWALTLVLSPDDAEGYNGQQGDLWDAHKDMALAMLGSTVAAGYYIVRSYLKRGKPFAE